MLGVTIWKIEKRDKIVGWLFGGGLHGTWHLEHGTLDCLSGALSSP
jgi:hypothetical protein